MKEAPAVPTGMVDVTPTKTAPPKVTAKVVEPPKPAEAVKPAEAKPAEESAPAAEGGEVVDTAATPETPSKFEQAKAAAEKAKKGAAANRKLMEEKQRLEGQARYEASRAQQLEQRLQQADALLTNLSRDPVAAMKQLGVPPEEIAKRMAMDGSPEAKIAALEQMILQERTERQKLVDAQRDREQEVRRAQLENEYKQEAQNDKKYPNLVGVHPDFILAATEKLIQQLQRRGHDPSRFSNHDLLEYLDSTYTKTQPTESPKEETPKVEKKTATITNKLQTAKHVAPPDPKMNDRQWKKWAADQLKTAMGSK